MSSPLKHALLDHHEPAYRVAMKMGISEVRLSKIANGLIEANPKEKETLSKILNKPVCKLFSKEPVEAD